jgi:hypothetical protein
MEHVNLKGKFEIHFRQYRFRIHRDEKSNLVHQMSQKHSPIIKRIADSPMLRMSILVLIHLDILISIAYVWMSLYDTAEPSIINGDKQMITLLFTDSYASNFGRNLLYWSHLLIRLVFLGEMVLSFKLMSDKNCTQKALVSLDSGVIASSVLLKLLLTGRASIVWNFVTVFRLVQNYIFMDNIIIQNERESEERIILIERHYESMIKNYEIRLDQSGSRLKQQEDKLKVMLGDISASDLIH